MYHRARRVLVGGVASSFQRRTPWPLYLARGEGPAVWDVDANRMLDFQNGFGAMVQGHAHPAIGRALATRYPLGTHFAAPTEDAIVVAEELERRWNLRRWRYANSGSEATMDAIRIARGYTGREVVMKTSGSYHGHHDTVMVDGENAGRVSQEDRHADAVLRRSGIPVALGRATVSVPFNDAPAMELRIDELDREGRKPACVIIEPAMMLGAILPEPGYLEAVRSITRARGIVLILDEVKTGLTIAAGGAVERYGVQGDLVTLAKALGGGLPSGAIGGTEEVMSVVDDGSVYHYGTFNGNPLVMAAARANLLEVLTPDAYAHLERLGRCLVDGCNAVLDRHRLAGYSHGVGARGCVTFAATRIVDHATFAANEDRQLGELIWLYLINRGIYTAAARPGQWMLSVAHSQADIDAYVCVFGELAAELAA